MSVQNQYLRLPEFFVFVEYILYVVALVVIIYIISRIGSTAYFNAKAEFIRRFKDDYPKDEKQGNNPDDKGDKDS